MNRLAISLAWIAACGVLAEPSLRRKQDDDKKAATSLFQRYMAVPVDVPMAQPPYPPYPPYMYDPSGYYYGGYPGMMAVPPPQPQYYMEGAPYYAYPQAVQQGPPPVPVQQQALPRSVSPPVPVYAPPQAVQQSSEQVRIPVAAQDEKPPVSVAKFENPVVEAPVREHTQAEKDEPSELKDKLTKALAEASKQMDKVTNNALAPNAFDDLIWKPTTPNVETMSLSDQTVPIDNHILNWRDLVGLPSEK
jgi:hypothetical protein